MKTKIRLPFNDAVATRFNDYLNSDHYKHEKNLLQHWSKRTSSSRNAFSVEGTDVIVDRDIVLSNNAPDDY